MNDTTEKARVENYFKQNKISLVKLNHCMSTYGPTQHDAYMQLSADGEFMEITKKMPRKRMFIMSANDNEIEIEKKKKKKERVEK